MKIKFESLFALSALALALLSATSKADDTCLNISGSWKLESPHCFTPAWTRRLMKHVWVEENQTLVITQSKCNSFSASAPESSDARSRGMNIVKSYLAPFQGVRQSVSMTADSIVTRSRDFDPAGIGLYGPYPSNVFEWTAKYSLSSDRSTLFVDIVRIDNGALTSHNQCVFARRAE